MSDIKYGWLKVPGASLAYEVRGQGPVLLMIAGGEGGGAGYNGVANKLADAYTVITYDRRGASGSPLDDPAAAVRLEMHSDDAHHLLDALAIEPAFVFGSSAGALIGLDLAVRYPRQVRAIVAHEPTVEGLLPDFDQFQSDLLNTYQLAGGLAALQMFITHLGVSYADREPDAEMPQQAGQNPAARGEALVAYTFSAVHAYCLDVEAVASLPIPIILAGGSARRDTHGYRCAAALAERLRKDLVEFPSHHAGYMAYPSAFAARLREVLGQVSE